MTTADFAQDGACETWLRFCKAGLTDHSSGPISVKKASRIMIPREIIARVFFFNRTQASCLGYDVPPRWGAREVDPNGVEHHSPARIAGTRWEKMAVMFRPFGV